MTSESSLWQTTKKHLSPFGRLVRIESPLTEPGIPDVIYCIQGVTGLLELKEIGEWPKRAATPINISHLKLEQVVFMEGWARGGGLASMLLQVSREYILVDHMMTRQIYARQATQADIRQRAVAQGVGAFPTALIARGLINISRGRL